MQSLAGRALLLAKAHVLEWSPDPASRGPRADSCLGAGWGFQAHNNFGVERCLVLVHTKGSICILGSILEPVGPPGRSAVKNPPADAGRAGSIPGSGRSLEEEMATHSSILAWRIPWTEEPGRLQSVGSRRAGHD